MQTWSPCLKTLRQPMRDKFACAREAHGHVIAVPPRRMMKSRRFEQRRCLIEELLHVECDFQALLMKPRTRTGIGRARYPAALSSRLRFHSNTS